MTVISLADKQAEVLQDVVDVLEEALALAREGKIVDLVIGFAQADQTFYTRASYGRFIVAVGLAEMLKREVVNSAED